MLEIGDILLNGNKTSLQVNLYDALVRLHDPFGHVRMAPTEFKKKLRSKKSKNLVWNKRIMSLKFGKVKNINVEVMQVIPIRTEDNKILRVTTGKCFSFGVKQDKKFKTTSMSLKLDDESVAGLQNIIRQCEQHLGKSLSKKVFYKDNTVYPKFKAATKLYEGVDEVDPSKYEDRCCDVKAVLEIGGILINDDKTSLQLKWYEALVKEPEHVRLVPMEF